MRHAVIDKGGLVVNVVEIDPEAQWSPPEDHLILDSDRANIGDNYDGKNFVAPSAPEPDPNAPAFVAGSDFLARLADAEYTAIIGAAQKNAQLARWIEILRMRGVIDVNGETAKRAKGAMVAAGLLTSDRADIIFARN
jgi:hypothetical protein